MTSGTFSTAPIGSIFIEDRQRTDLPDIETLADSIRRLGLIHPPVVTRDMRLVAGRRRLAACTALGWTDIPFQYQDEIDLLTLHAVELEENVKRKDLSWQDHSRAIATYHKMRAGERSDWTAVDTAAALGVDPGTISRHLMVSEEMATDAQIATAPKFSVARGIATRKRERRSADLMAQVDPGDCRGQSSGQTSHILTESFTLWAPLYTGQPFNLLHIDFPYGVEHARDSTYGATALQTDDYADGPEVFWALCAALRDNLDRLCAESAHALFWFTPNLWWETWEFLETLPGFRWDTFPLIWLKSDNAGIAPDPSHRPRRIYESAFFGWRGDRPIISLKANAFAAPTDRSRHPHEKSQPMLEYFFSMLVDKQTRLFDPTCGSGAALRAAKALGAAEFLGLEINEEYASVARRALEE